LCPEARPASLAPELVFGLDGVRFADVDGLEVVEDALALVDYLD